MGIAKRQIEEKREKRFQRSATSSYGPADWGSIDGSLLLRVLGIVSARGGALRLGYTRDGGAYAVGIYGDGEPYTEYVRPSESMETFLNDLADYWDNLTFPYPLASDGKGR